MKAPPALVIVMQMKGSVKSIMRWRWKMTQRSKRDKELMFIEAQEDNNDVALNYAGANNSLNTPSMVFST